MRSGSSAYIVVVVVGVVVVPRQSSSLPCLAAAATAAAAAAATAASAASAAATTAAAELNLVCVRESEAAAADARPCARKQSRVNLQAAAHINRKNGLTKHYLTHILQHL
jgi:hypothetical protein